MLDPREVDIPDEGDYPEATPSVYASVIEGKSLGRSLNSVVAPENNEHISPHLVDDAENMVEELTLHNFSTTSLVGTSSGGGGPDQWQHFYQQMGGRSASAGSPGKPVYRDAQTAACNTWEELGTQIMAQKPDNRHDKELAEPAEKSSDSHGTSENALSPGGIRTKMISKSGFTEFFVKSSIKGKGVIYRCPTSDGIGSRPRENCNARIDGASLTASDTSVSSRENAVIRCTDVNGEKNVVPMSSLTKSNGSSCIPCNKGTKLREWLTSYRHKINKTERLCIFRHIVELVHQSHSQDLAVQEVRPSCFKILPPTKVEYVGLPPQRDNQGNVTDQCGPQLESQETQKRRLDRDASDPFNTKKFKRNQDLNISGRWPQFASRFTSGRSNGIGINISDPQHSMNFGTFQTESSNPPVHSLAQQQMTAGSNLEDQWYTTHEKGSCPFSANVYCLGVILFELLGSFDSEKEHVAAMLDLHHRILPPKFLAENPREAGFCLWLLHPESSSRPTTRDILQSELISGLQEECEKVPSLSIENEDVEAELVLHFLAISREQKEKHSFKLVEDIRALEEDIKEVQRRQLFKGSLGHSFLHDSLSPREHILHREIQNLDVLSQFQASCSSHSRSIKNISQLEDAYFSMRSQTQGSAANASARPGKYLLHNGENLPSAQEAEGAAEQPDRVGAFFDGLCKYARYSKFEVRGLLRNGDLNSANVICSLSFDRDEDYFAAAGVSKKIKVFEYQPLLNDSVDVHYPAIEMSNRSKLSSICWNAYIKNYLASTDYDGLVKLWDVSSGQAFSEYNEHQKRAWSVDFSRLDPTKFASGSDDCLVKLWSISQRNSIGTIRNIANVCCVQFSSHSSNLLTFGSADYKTYCYDLRNTNSPWCVLAGHQKAVSYVKFVDSQTLVSASTDNKLKLWDLSKTSSTGLSTDACSLTFSGHTNEKNFVGLSVAGGYIACGSETNEVYAYYKSFPMPISSYKFGSIDPISGKETDDENGHFVSSVCWRGKSDTIIAANSTGCIKVLQMV